MRSTGGVVLLILLIVGAPALAAEGTSGAQWLAIGVGARAAALGGAYVSLADDGAALSWNPAGLARVDGHRFTVSHISWLSGATYEYGGYAGTSRVGRRGRRRARAGRCELGQHR